MIGKSKIAAFAFSLLFASAIAAGSAQAACSPAAIQGNWLLHGMTHDSDEGTTIQCLIKVKTDGTGGVKAGSKCVEKRVDDNGDFEIGPGNTGAGKSLKVATSCKVTGGMKIKVDTVDVIGTAVINIESAQMSRDGEIITGVGRSVFKGTAKQFDIPVSNNSVFYFTMNKK